MHFGSKNSNYQYNVNSTILESKNEIKNLGVTVDTKLKFTEHIKIVKTKCYKIINIFFKCFKLRDQECYCKLYKIFVLPLIFYCMPIYFTNT